MIPFGSGVGSGLVVVTTGGGVVTGGDGVEPEIAILF